MRIVPRKKLFLDVIPFPAEKKDAGALTLLGDELAPFEKNPGAVRVQLVAADLAKTTTALDVKLNVSYDEGKTWVEAESFNNLKKSTGTASVLKDGLLKFAPMVRLDAVFGSTGDFEEGHGCKVHAELSEGSLLRHVFFKDVVKIPSVISTEDIDAVAATATMAATVIGELKDGDTITISDGETAETYEFLETTDEYSGSNTPVKIEEGNTLTNFLTALGENENGLVTAEAESEGIITFTAKIAGVAGNSITITVDGEDPIHLTGGKDAEEAGEIEITGDKLFVETNNLKKVLVISTSDKEAGEGKTFSYTLMSSYNGEDWWAVGDKEEDIEKGIKEKEYSTKLGNYLRVDFKADDLDLEDHNARIHLVAYYA